MRHHGPISDSSRRFKAPKFTRNGLSRSSVYDIAELLSDALVRKAVDVSLDVFVTISHADLEYLISRVWRSIPSLPPRESSH